MNKNTLLGFALIIVMILSLALPGCQKTSEPSELPYEALHLGNFLFVITKTTEDTKTILHLPVVAHFDEPQDLQVGDVMALAFDQLMESFPPQAVITSSKKLLEEHKAYLANFDLAQQLLEIRPEQTYLIDVRTKEEFEEGHVPNSNILIHFLSHARILGSMPKQCSKLMREKFFRSEMSQISYRERRSLILTLPSSLPSSTPLSFSALKT
jgi:rhodanese-related sulfurtransferase